MQAKDITAEAVEAAIGYVIDKRGFHNIGANKWDITLVIQGRADAVGTDEGLEHVDRETLKVVNAKLRKMVRSGRLTGCYCGCRGDYLIRDHAELVGAAG